MTHVLRLEFDNKQLSCVLLYSEENQLIKGLVKDTKQKTIITFLVIADAHLLANIEAEPFADLRLVTKEQAEEIVAAESELKATDAPRPVALTMPEDDIRAVKSALTFPFSPLKAK